MSILRCPACGREEMDPEARFCDVDGTPLEETSEPPNGYKRSSPSPRLEGRRTGGGQISKTQADSSPLAIMEPYARSDGPRKAGISHVLKGIAGILMASAGLWIISDLQSNLSLSDTEVRLGNLGDESPPGVDSVNTLLRACYGAIPGIPESSGDEPREAFQTAKDLTRLGVKLGTRVTGKPLSVAEEVHYGDEVLAQFAREPGFTTGTFAANRLQRLSSLLTAHAPRRVELDYQFWVLASQEINAFMAPGGRSFFFQGLIEAMPDDAELAFVIGHELAHAELKHSLEQLEIAAAGKRIGGILLGRDGESLGSNLSAAVGKLLTATYDQDHEFEADRLGSCFAFQAGIDPGGGAAAIRTLKRKETKRKAPRGGSVGRARGAERIAYDIVSSHPPLEEREAYLNQLRVLMAEHGHRN